MDLTELRVYDPGDDGLDYKTYAATFWSIFQESAEKAKAFHDGIMDEISYSEVSEGSTLEECIGRYFEDNKKISAVLFIGGRYHSSYCFNEISEMDILAIAVETNKVPALYITEHGWNAYSQWGSFSYHQ